LNPVVASYTTTVAADARSARAPPPLPSATPFRSYSVTAAVADHAGNPASPASRPLTVDETAPGVVVSISDTELNAGETATVGFAFSRPHVGTTLTYATATPAAPSNIQTLDASHSS